MNRIEKTLEELSASGNLRAIPGDTPAGLVDLSSNDYLGLAVRDDLRDAFLGECGGRLPLMTSSASRLLAGCQSSYDRFESLLSELYGAPALTFNSGYHANTGLVSSLADRSTLIVADRLVHASIIDGIKLSGAHSSVSAITTTTTSKRYWSTKAATTATYSSSPKVSTAWTATAPTSDASSTSSARRPAHDLYRRGPCRRCRRHATVWAWSKTPVLSAT